MDRVSNLPDEILCHILSFLPTKQAAVTTVLSKRWLNLWKLVPHLDIDDSVFLHPEGKAERVEIRQSFVEFVDGVLAMQGDSPVKKFSLKCITGIHPDIVNRWICNVVQRGVIDLNLFTDFSDEDTEEDSYRLPKEMFVSKTLVNLKLRSEHCVDWWWGLYKGRAGSSLPKLKSLDINAELIFCGEIEEFIPSFPVLEDLRMANMEWGELDVTISSKSLKKLSLHGTGCDEFESPKTFSFDTPNLLFLNYSEVVAEDYPLVKMEKLLEARINLIVTTDNQIKRIRAPENDLFEGEDDDDRDVVLKFGNVVKLMNGIRNVTRLSLEPDTLEVLSLCSETMPVFNNLKFLGVISEEGRGWQAMPVLLKNAPHLETNNLRGSIRLCNR